MSVYKEPVEWLKQSIDSILQQTFKDFEFIIICDNPAYIQGIALLKDYSKKDNRIHLLFNENNIGLTKCLNKGIAIARGEFIARMDADDISDPIRFDKQITFLKAHPEVGVCGSIIEYIGERKGLKLYPEKYEDMYLFLESPFAHPTVMIRKEVLPLPKCYDEGFLVSQDYALWTELYAKGVLFYNFPIPLLHYRVSGQQIMANKNSVQHELSCIIRRRAFDYYNEKHDNDYRIGGKEITLPEIDLVRREVSLPTNVKKLLLYYLYISTSEGLIRKLYNLVKSGDLFRLSFMNNLRIIKYQLCGLDASKF